MTVVVAVSGFPVFRVWLSFLLNVCSISLHLHDFYDQVRGILPPRRPSQRSRGRGRRPETGVRSETSERRSLSARASHVAVDLHCVCRRNRRHSTLETTSPCIQTPDIWRHPLSHYVDPAADCIRVPVLAVLLLAHLFAIRATRSLGLLFQQLPPPAISV